MSLVISRTEQESIVVFTANSEQIRITVNSAKSGRTKLVFDAPDTVDIWREELLEDEDEDE